MVWQDIAIAGAQFIFVVALVAEWWAGTTKVRPLVGVGFFTGLVIIGATFVSLELWFSAATSFAQATLWGLILVRILQRPSEARCDWHGTCHRRAYVEVYYYDHEDGAVMMWSYLCFWHFWLARLRKHRFWGWAKE